MGVKNFSDKNISFRISPNIVHCGWSDLDVPTQDLKDLDVKVLGLCWLSYHHDVCMGRDNIDTISDGSISQERFVHSTEDISPTIN